MNLNKSINGFRAATLIQFGSKYFNVFIQLAITMVLARLLTPEQYGVMAVIAVFIGFFTLLSEIGVGPAIIQYRELSDEDCSALMSFTLLMGVVLAFVFCAMSFVVSSFFVEPEYIPLMCFASIAVVFQAVNMVPNGILIRDKKFLVIAIRTVTVTVISGICAVVLAFLGYGTYALVANLVISSFLTVLWNVTRSGLRFGNWHFGKQLKIVGKFSVYQFVSQMVQYFIRNLDALLIGVVLGSTALG